MKKTVLKKYYDKGLLKNGDPDIGPEDRLYAGYVFYQSYLKSHIISTGVSDWLRPLAEGNIKGNVIESKLQQKDVFLKAYCEIPLQCRKVVQKIVLDNQEPNANRGDIKFFAEVLCRGLDALTRYYKLKREDKDAKKQV